MSSKYPHKFIVIFILSLFMLPLFGDLGHSIQYSKSISLGLSDASIIGDNGTIYAGFPVSSHGDVNGDGIDDLLVGSGNGAFLFFGRTSGWKMGVETSSADVWFDTPRLSYQWNDLAIIGDVNGDNYDDIAIQRNNSMAIILGRHDGWESRMNIDNATNFRFINQSYDEMYWYVSGVGDLNGDGLDDFVICPPYEYAQSPAYIYLILGKKDGWALTNDLNSTKGYFTTGNGTIESKIYLRPISGGGDINGDGLDDLLIRYTSGNSTGQEPHKIAIFYGKKTGWDTAIPLDSANAFIVYGSRSMGYSGYIDNIDGWLDIRGDYNNDGIDDVLISTAWVGGGDYNGTCVGFYLLFGQKEWPNSTDVADSTVIYYIQSDYSSSYISISSAGDVNGDGFDDILVGHPAYAKNHRFGGAAYLILGRENGWTNGGVLDSVADSVFVGETENDMAGKTVEGGGDINGDGLGDLLVSSEMNPPPWDNYWYGQVYIILSQKGNPQVTPHSFKVYSDENCSLPITSAFIGDRVWIELKTGDVDPLHVNSVEVRLIRGTGFPDKELLKLNETGKNTGDFRGTVTLSNEMDLQNGSIGANLDENLTFQTIQQPKLNASLIVHAIILETDNHSGMVRIGNPYSARYWTRGNYTFKWNFTTNATWLTWDPVRHTVSGFQNDSKNLVYYTKVNVSDGLGHSDEIDRTLTTNIGMTQIRILSPANGTAYNDTQALAVALNAYGPGNSTNITIHYRWYDNGLQIAEGRNGTVRLKLGNHTLELRADDGWKKVTDSVNVSVVKPELTPPLNPGQNSSGGQNQIPPKKPVMKDNRSFYAMAILGILPIILSVIVLIATTEVGKYGSILALAPLYSKIRKDALLDNFKRGQIYRLIVEHPGVHFSRILSELDINNGAATFHLKKLEDDQYIISKTDGFKKRFYPGDKAVPSLPSKFEQIAAEVRLHAGITQKELSKEFDIPTSTINVYIKKMEASGVITTVRKGKKVLCYLNEDTNEK